MSQSAHLRQLDADIMAAFKSAGMADEGAYTPPGGGMPAACDVLVDRNVSVFGGGGGDVAVYRVVLTLFRGQVAPRRGGVVVVDGDTWTLDEELEDSDASRTRWTVRA